MLLSARLAVSAISDARPEYLVSRVIMYLLKTKMLINNVLNYRNKDYEIKIACLLCLVHRGDRPFPGEKKKLGNKSVLTSR